MARMLKTNGVRLGRWWTRGGRLSVQLFILGAMLGATISAVPYAVVAVIAPEMAESGWLAILAGLLPTLAIIAMTTRRRLLKKIPPLPCSRAFGLAARWTRTRAIQSLLWLALIAVIAWLIDVFVGDPLGGPDVSWPDVGRVLTLLLLLIALLMTLRARRGVIVEEFADYTADAPTRTQGLAHLLMHRLDHLAELHRAVDEQRVVPTAVGNAAAIGASMNADGDSDFLRKDFSAEEQLRVGPLSVPIRAVAAVLGRVARGPRLMGSLHRHGDVLALIARTSGLRPAYGLRVERTVAPNTSVADMVRAMADEVACRVFSDLALNRSVRWKATRCFAEGLENYRDSLKTPLDRVKKLRQAERNFLEAASEDRDFDLAYHNLGVVYVEQNRLPAAERAFRAAIDINPQRLETYYALALLDLERGRLDDALRGCERMLQGKPDREQATEAQDLIGVIHLQKGEATMALRRARKAARRARLVLRRRYLTPWLDHAERPLRRIEEKVAVYLFNYAVAHAELVPQDTVNLHGWWHVERARALLRKSIRLEPARHNAHLTLGRMLLPSDDEAIQALRMATQLAARDSRSWAYLALALATRNEVEETVAACSHALSNPWTAVEFTPDVFDLVAQAYEQLGDAKQATRVRAMPEIVSKLPSVANPDDLAAVESQLEHDDWSGRGWERAQFLLLLFDKQPSVEQGNTRSIALPKAQRWLEEAIELLEQDRADEEIRARGLQALLARVLLMRREHAAALARAERALDLDPISWYERAMLGSVYMEISELKAARGAFEEALLQHPEQTQAQLQLADVLLTLAENSRDGAERARLLNEAQDHAERALTLFRAEDVGPKADTLLFLASIARSRLRYDNAAAHSLVAHNLDPSRVAPVLMLAEMYRRKRAFSAAARWYAVVMEKARQAGGNNDGTSAGTTCADVVDSFSGVEIRRGEALAEAYLGLAALRFDRCVDTAAGRALARAARRHLASSGLQGERRDQLDAQCLASIAWSHVLEGNLESGVRGLEQAAARYPDPDLYLRWALALEMQAQLEGTDRQRLYARARERALLAQQLDAAGANWHAIDALLQRLAAPISPRPPQASESHEVDEQEDAAFDPRASAHAAG